MLRYPYGSVIAEIGVNERAVIAGQTLVIALYPVWRLVRLADGRIFADIDRNSRTRLTITQLTPQ